MVDFKRQIRAFDFLVKPYQFKIKDSQQASTVAGGLLSIVIFGFTIYYFVSQLLGNIFAVKQYTTSQDPTLQLQSNQLNFSILFYDFNNVPMTNWSSVFNVQAFIRNETDLLQIDAIECKQSNFMYGQNNSQNQLCFNRDQFIINNSNTLQIIIHNITSLNNEKIRLYLQDNLAQNNLIHDQLTFIQNISFDISLIKDQQLIQSFDLAPFQIDTRSTQIFALSQDSQYQTLFQGYNIINKQKYYMQGQTSSVIQFQKSSQSIYQTVIQQGWDVIILQTVSQSSGLAIAFISLAQFFYAIYNHHKMFEIMMNYVFKFDVDQQKRASQMNMFQSQGINTDEHRPTITPVRRKNQGESLEQIFKFNIKYNFCNYLSFQVQKFLKKICRVNITFLRKCFTINERIVTISEMAKQKVESDLDLTNILKKLYEIDCLKLLLFDDDQLTFFNSFCSPVFQYEQLVYQQDVLKEYKAQQNPLCEVALEKQISPTGGMTLALQSKIPISTKLAKVARFFKAEVQAQNPQELIQIFRKLKNNENSNFEYNKKLQQFAQYNETLYKLVNNCANNSTTKGLSVLNVRKVDEEEEIHLNQSSRRFMTTRPQKHHLSIAIPQVQDGDSNSDLVFGQ